MRWVVTILILCAFVSQASARPPEYLEYYASVVKVIDGDTIRAKVKIWPKLTELATIRVRGIDTPEMRPRCPREKELAILARDYVRGLLKPGAIIKVQNIKLGKYAGRVVANILIQDTGGRWVDLSEAMIAANYARPYFGGKRKGWC